MTGQEFLDQVVAQYHALDECEKADLLSIIGELDIQYMEHPGTSGLNICLLPEGPNSSKRVCIYRWLAEPTYSPYSGRQIGEGTFEYCAYNFRNRPCPCCGRTS